VTPEMKTAMVGLICAVLSVPLTAWSLYFSAGHTVQGGIPWWWRFVVSGGATALGVTAATCAAALLFGEGGPR
jgi:hypothetical protein